MEKKIFFDRFVGLLENTRDRYELETKHDAFILWFAEYFIGIEPEDTAERIIKDKHAEGIDAVLLDQQNYEVVFVQGETVDKLKNTEKNFSENNLKNTFEGFRLLMKDYKGKITGELENLVDEYHELVERGGYATRIVFLTLKRKPLADTFIENFKRDYPMVSVDFYGIKEIHDIYEKKYLGLRAQPPETVTFEVVDTILKKEKPRKSRVFTSRGRDIARAYNNHKERILDQDLRYSLGMKSIAINKQILDTAGDESKCAEFWYYNNGVTIVCDEINETPSGKVINLKNAQIINGAQTTCALYEAFQKGELKEDVEVLIKVIESGDRSFIQNVTLYTNYQNPIRLRDLCSNDEIQREIKRILFDSYGYYYDRKRGEFEAEYINLAERKKAFGQNYKAKVVNNENAGQAYLALYLNRPAQSKNEKWRIFLKEKAGFYDDIFNKKDTIIAEKLLLAWKLLKFVETYKKEYNKEYKKAIDLPEEKAEEIYRYDFLLHSEYFILNLMYDFIKNSGIDITTDRDGILEAISELDDDGERLAGFYEKIKDDLSVYIRELRKDPKYYHNKFFKNETSIGLIRDFFKGKYKFVTIIG